MTIAFHSTTKPSQARIDQFLRQQASLDFNHPEVGASAGTFPDGYDCHEVAVELGHGLSVFEQAKAALQARQQFEVGWVTTAPSEPPLRVGETIAIQARIFCFWTLAACRIIAIEDERSPESLCYGFTFSTLAGHPEQGEELFRVRISQDERVFYQVAAFFRPNGRLVRIAQPYAHYRVNQFRWQSADRMKKLVSEP